MLKTITLIGLIGSSLVAGAFSTSFTAPTNAGSTASSTASLGAGTIIGSGSPSPVINTSGDDARSAGKVFEEQHEEARQAAAELQNSDTKGVFKNTQAVEYKVQGAKNDPTPPPPPPPPPPAPTSITYKFNQQDGNYDSLISGLSTLAKKAGGKLVKIKNVTTYSKTRNNVNFRDLYVYQFQNIKKTISWKICANSYTTGDKSCQSLPLLTPSNQKSYAFTMARDQKNGADNDGIAIYKKRIATKTYTYSSVFPKVEKVLLKKGSAYYGKIFDLWGFAIQWDYSRAIRTSPRHYTATIK